MKELAKRELARRHLLNFIKYRFIDFKENWHHKVLSKALEQVKSGEIKNLMVFMPPRHSKSEMVSVNFPAWIYLDEPDAHVMEVSYNATLATGFGRQVRNIMDSPEYAVLSDTRLSDDSKSKSTFGVKNGRGEYNAMGIGGSATGKGAKYLIIDDPVKNREEAESEVVSESVWDWYKSVAETRLSPDGRKIIVMTRWNDKDLAGRILSDPIEAAKWEVVSFPAIAEEDEEYRKEGEALWADHFTLDNLLGKKQTIGTFEWAALYQQNPIPRDEAEFREEMFVYMEMKDMLKKQVICWITIDAQGKEKATKKSDFTGITINWVDRDNIWYLKAYKVKIGPTALIDLIFDLHNIYKPEAIGIEETQFTDAIQPFLTIEMAKRNIFPNVIGLKHGGTAKESRIRWLLPRYERKHIVHLTGLCTDLEEQLLRFPASAHDDVMDSTAYQVQIAQPPYYTNEDDTLPDEPEPLYDDIGL